MAVYYTSTTTLPSKDQQETWAHLVQKKNWRIVHLPSGYYQTEFRNKYDENRFHGMTRRTTIEEAEEAIDNTIEHYSEKIAYYTPEVVKTFE
jgi:hypothetical protein